MTRLRQSNCSFSSNFRASSEAALPGRPPPQTGTMVEPLIGIQRPPSSPIVKRKPKNRLVSAFREGPDKSALYGLIRSPALRPYPLDGRKSAPDVGRTRPPFHHQPAAGLVRQFLHFPSSLPGQESPTPRPGSLAMRRKAPPSPKASKPMMPSSDRCRDTTPRSYRPSPQMDSGFPFVCIPMRAPA